MQTTREQALALLAQMSPDELAALNAPVRRIVRKKTLSEKYRAIAISVPPELESVLQHLCEEHRLTMSALIRMLVKLGLPALTGKHVHELLEDTERVSNVTVTLGG